MDNNTLRYTLTDDRTAVDLHAFGGRLGIVEVEQLIADLGRVRASMAPSVRESLNEGAGSTQYMDCLTAWGMGDSHPLPTRHGALLLGCSSAYGWFHLPVSPEFCQQLADWLTTDGGSMGVVHDRPAAH